MYPPMKVEGNGQGKIFTPDELRLLFTDGLVTPRDCPRGTSKADRALLGIHL